MINAFVSIEDSRFWTHNGIDLRSISRAAVGVLTGENRGGGSTITQQLIKNMTDDDEVTVKRKVMEIFRALEFEKNYSKEEILELTSIIFTWARAATGYTPQRTPTLESMCRNSPWQSVPA